jgi:elongation factor Ts
MPKVSIENIRALRAETGSGVMDVKRALEDADGSIENARALLRDRGLELSAKRAARDTGEGIIEAYVHPGRPLGALLELRCETDFVARTPEFTALAHDLVMHIAAMAPERVADDDGDGQALFEQPWFRDTSRKVREVVQDVEARVGERIQVTRFIRYEI